MQGVEFCLHPAGTSWLQHKIGSPKLASNGVEQITAIILCGTGDWAQCHRKYIETPIGSMTRHKFIAHTQGTPSYMALPKSMTSSARDLCCLVEAYMDDYISLAIYTSQEQLDQVANGIMWGIHMAFHQMVTMTTTPFHLRNCSNKRAHGTSSKISWYLCFMAVTKLYG